MPFQSRSDPRQTSERESQLQPAKLSMWPAVAAIQAVDRTVDSHATRLLTLERRVGTAEKKLVDCEKTVMQFESQLESKWAALGTLIQGYGRLQRRLENMENLLKNRNFWILRLPPGARGEVPKQDFPSQGRALERVCSYLFWKDQTSYCVTQTLERLSPSADYAISKPDLLSRIERGEEPCVGDQGRSEESEIPADPSPESPVSAPDISLWINQEENPGCGGRGDSGENEISGSPCSEFPIVPPDAASWVKREEEPCGQDRPVCGEGRTPAGPSPESPAPAPDRSPWVKPEPEACAGTQPTLEQRGLPGEPSAAGEIPLQLAEEHRAEEGGEGPSPPRAVCATSKGTVVQSPGEGPAARQRSILGRSAQGKRGIGELRAAGGQQRAVGGERPSPCPVRGKCLGQKQLLLSPKKSLLAEKPAKCRECGKSVGRIQCCLQHQHMPPGKLPFTCAECRKRFRKKRPLLFPPEPHTAEQPFSCPACGKAFSQRDTLLAHQKTHDLGLTPLHELSKCLDSLFLSAAGRIGMKAEERQVEEKPEILELTTTLLGRADEEAFQSQDQPAESPCGPEGQQGAGEPTACGSNLCEFKPGAAQKEAHAAQGPCTPADHGTGAQMEQLPPLPQRILTGEKPYNSAECLKSVCLQPSLRKHQLSHAGQGTYVCAECRRSFRLKRSLLTHQRTHVGESDGSFICTACGKNFGCHLELTRRQRLHDGERRYKCPECPKSFLQKRHLADHKRLHTGERPFPCPACEKTFNEKSNLNKHYRIHTGERPYHCALCGKSFIQKHHLQKHLRVHGGPRPQQWGRWGDGVPAPAPQANPAGERLYPCIECMESFTQKTSLEQHQRMHTQERPFQCTKCNKSFRHRQSLNNHQKSHSPSGGSPRHRQGTEAAPSGERLKAGSNPVGWQWGGGNLQAVSSPEIQQYIT
ncbi:zinc finger protein 282-like [Terrapene carolina triunguis]|uniref:zinc finger protein 282-like n=1 Tax=Terrapene triunguis TaxID=2587831 RepID=UPI00115663BA|nr:zinc finger protein 282-like [Terrapene carolina triunguis]